MAPSRRPTPAQIRERRARTTAIVLGVFMLIVAFVQGPKLLSAISGGSSGGAATTDAATTVASATAVATITPSSSMSGGQLFGFGLLKKQSNPFHSQLPTAAPTTSGSQTSTTTTSASKGASSSTSTAKATTTNSTTTTPTSTAAVTTTPAPVTLPITVATPVGPIAALIKVNGKLEKIGVQGTFPKKSPLFELVSFKGKQARIEVVGGSFAGGQPYLLLAPGQKVTFVDQSDGTRMSVRFMKTAHVPQEELTSPTQTTTPSGSSVAPASTTGTTG